jgi:uncharacterized protein YodC (DUF2158 family)
MEIGTLVSLRSGGPAMTVVQTHNTAIQTVTCLYFNTVSGLFVEHCLPTACLRAAGTKPETPTDASSMRVSSLGGAR